MMDQIRLVITLGAKDLRLLRRDKGTIFFIAVFPVLMGLLFGLIGGSFAAGPDEGSAKMRVGVVDHDNSEISQQFLASIEALERIETEPVERAAGVDRVRKGDLLAVIIIPEGFGESAGVMWLEQPTIEVGFDPSRAAERAFVEGYLMQAAGELLMARFQDIDTMRSLIRDQQSAVTDQVPPLLRPLLLRMLDSIDQVMVQADELSDAGEGEGDGAGGGFQMELVKVRQIDVTRPEAADPSLAPPPAPALLDAPEGAAADSDSAGDGDGAGEGDGAADEDTERASGLRSVWDISFPQAMLWGVLGCVAGFATSVVQERTRGTLYRLQVAPCSLGHVLAGKALACFLTVVIVITALTVLGVILGLTLDSFPLLAVAIVSVAFCFTGLMMTFSVLGDTEEVVSGASWGANVVMAMFGGGMFPLAFMPGWMSTLSNFSPVKWGILAIEGASWRGFAFAEMLVPCAVLIAIGSAGLVLGTTILRRRVG